MKAILTLAVMSAFAFAAFAEPAVSEQMIYYDVSGSTVGGNWPPRCAKRGPVDSDGHKYDADTKWFVKWAYRYQQTGEGCRLQPVTVSVRVDYIVPRLAAPSAVPANLRGRWDNFASKLTTHERGHGRHGVDAARDVERSLRELFGSCKTIGAEADALARQVIAKYNRLDVQYDAETHHGASQGAVLR